MRKKGLEERKEMKRKERGKKKREKKNLEHQSKIRESRFVFTDRFKNTSEQIKSIFN